jgi:hypothetical protein
MQKFKDGFEKFTPKPIISLEEIDVLHPHPQKFKKIFETLNDNYIDFLFDSEEYKYLSVRETLYFDKLSSLNLNPYKTFLILKEIVKLGEYAEEFSNLYISKAKKEIEKYYKDIESKNIRQNPRERSLTIGGSEAGFIIEN